MLKNKIIDYFLKQAEIGNWDKLKFSDAEKKLNLKKNSIKGLFSDKIYFLEYYDRFIDTLVMNSLSPQDINENNPSDIIQEYLMNKLDYMNEHKLGISNIINFYFNNPKFYLISLKSSKLSAQIFLDCFLYSNNIIRKKLFEKAILVTYLLGFKKWLYEDNTNNGAFALIDKGIKRIKKSTNFFEDLIKK
jgi:hypothetical protein